jgi:hypothetical protein
VGTGEALENQPGDPRDLAEAPLRELAGIQARQHIGQQIAFFEQRPVVPGLRCDLGSARQQLEPAVVDRDRKRPACSRARRQHSRDASPTCTWRPANG